LSTLKPKNFADRLRTALDAAFPKESLSEIARRLGFHANTLHNYLQQDRAPSFDFLVAIAEVGVDVHWLVSGSGTPIADNNEERHRRVEVALSSVSRAGLMAEVDRRARTAITEGIALLKELQRADFSGLAKKVKRDDSHQELTGDQERLLAQMRRAFFILSDIAFWYPDLGSDLYLPFVEFLTLHEEVTNDPKFRAAFYANEQNTALRTSEPGIPFRKRRGTRA